MEATLGALARLRSRREVVGFVSRMRHRKGSYRFLEWRATAGEDLIYATARDITDQRLAEAALRESEMRFRAIFEQATVGVAEADAETGRYVRINQRFCDILGFSQDELLSRGLDSLTHPKDLPYDLAILKGFQDQATGDAGDEKRCLHKDGHTVWINLQVKTLSEPDVPARHIVVVIEDITSRKQTDELLHRSLADVIETNQRLNFQITRMPLGYIAWDLEFRVTVWNASAERIFGYPAAEALGKHVYHLLVPPEVRAKTTQFWDAVVNGNDRDSHAILDNCKRDGQRITCEWFGAPDVDASGRIVGCLSMVHDVTERLRLEEKLLHSQRMESLGSFAGGVAHDMNNVLRTIMDLASSTQLSEPDSETLAKRMDKVLQACGRGRTFVRGLLDFSRQDIPDTKMMDLNEVIEEQVRFLGRSIQPSIRVLSELDGNLRPLRGDAFALGGAIMHLLMNALDAMPSGGLLTLRTRMQGEASVQIDVEDTGCGMTKDILEKAMEPFFTTKPQGKGAGLGSARRLRIGQGPQGIDGDPQRARTRYPGPNHPAPVATRDEKPGDPQRQGDWRGWLAHHAGRRRQSGSNRHVRATAQAWTRCRHRQPWPRGARQTARWACARPRPARHRHACVERRRNLATIACAPARAARHHRNWEHGTTSRAACARLCRCERARQTLQSERAQGGTRPVGRTIPRPGGHRVARYRGLRVQPALHFLTICPMMRK